MGTIFVVIVETTQTPELKKNIYIYILLVLILKEICLDNKYIVKIYRLYVLT